jgi:hypothetical protein
VTNRVTSGAVHLLTEGNGATLPSVSKGSGKRKKGKGKREKKRERDEEPKR